MLTEDGIAGLFEITSNQFEDTTKVWPDRIYPYRVNINPIKVLSPENRIPITEHNIKQEFLNAHGRGWGTIIILALKPVDQGLAKKIEKIIEEQPSYDPFPTIEDDIKKLSDLVVEPKPTKARRKKRPVEPEPDEKSLHDSIRDMIAKIGKWEGKHPETEYRIGNLGRLDVVWKKIKTGHPSYAFEVQIKGNFYQALAKLKHAFDLWNSTPVLVTTRQYVTQAEELLSGSFHEMRRQARVINYEKIQELFSLEKKLHQLKGELDL